MNNPYRPIFGNDGNSNSNINKLTTQQQFSNQISSQFKQHQQQSQSYLQGSTNNFLISTTSNNNGNTIPNSPHSDTAALPPPPSSLGNLTKRPLSVPPQNMGNNGNLGGGKIGGGGGKQQQQLYNIQNSAMSAREYFSLQIRRPQQISQPPIAEEVEIVGQNKNVIINEDDGKEYFLNEESGGGGGGKRRHSSSFSSSQPNNQSKKLRNQPISTEVVTLEEDDEIETEDSETITEQNINSTTTDSTEIPSQLQKKNTATTSLASTALMNAASGGGFTEHPSIGHSPIKSIEYKRTDIGEDNQVKSQQQQEELELRRQRRRAPILLDSRSLERAMGQRIEAPSEQHPTPPLEQFLQSQYLLSRLQPFFEFAAAETQQRRGELGGKLNLQVKEYQCSPQQGTLTVTFPSHPLSLNNTNNIDTLNAPQQQQTLNHMIKMQLLICPKDLRLITKLDYSGFNCPLDSDVRIFERFFASFVAQVDNELAVFSFTSLCRSSAPKIFSSFARLMLSQMEPGNYPWRIEFELINIPEDLQQKDQQQQQQNFPTQQPNLGQTLKNVQQSVVISDMNKQITFCLFLYPNNCANKTYRHRLKLRYIIDSNDLVLHHIENQEQADINKRINNALFTARLEMLNKQEEPSSSSILQREQQCCIWPCVRALLEGKHQ
uniref:Uncharacterized protein n=1 Tax=Meloidogyne enterolobii TaxID=390850 RepID=A0A6V7WDV5_MELEN|nr:unnamed protein product [Meloidogyne enterolobii]